LDLDLERERGVQIGSGSGQAKKYKKIIKKLKVPMLLRKNIMKIFYLDHQNVEIRNQ
jgi:hypothetical protein